MKIYVVTETFYEDGGALCIGASLSPEGASIIKSKYRDLAIQREVERLDHIPEEEREPAAVNYIEEYYYWEVQETELDEDLIYEHSAEGEIRLKGST